MSLFFDGVDDFGNLGNSVSGNLLKPTAFPFAIFAWIKLVDVNNRYEIISCEEATAEGYEFSVRGDQGGKPLEFGCFRITQFPVISVGTLTANKWTFVGAAWVGNTAGQLQYKAWIDSTEYTNNNAAAVTITYQSRVVSVGRNGGGSNFFKGKIAHLHFYNISPTYAEVQSIRFRPASVQRGLLDYQMFGGSGSPQGDYSGRGNSCSLNAGAIWNPEEPPVNGIFIPTRSKIFTFGNPRAILQVLGAQSVANVVATSIDSSVGNQVSDQDGTISDTVNWVAPITPAGGPPPPSSGSKRRRLLGVGL